VTISCGICPARATPRARNAPLTRGGMNIGRTTWRNRCGRKLRDGDDFARADDEDQTLEIIAGKWGLGRAAEGVGHVPSEGCRPDCPAVNESTSIVHQLAPTPGLEQGHNAGIGSGEVVAITKLSATIRTRGGATLTFPGRERSSCLPVLVGTRPRMYVLEFDRNGRATGGPEPVVGPEPVFR
jgi:hypothetical protein